MPFEQLKENRRNYALAVERLTAENERLRDRVAELENAAENWKKEAQRVTDLTISVRRDLGASNGRAQSMEMAAIRATDRAERAEARVAELERRVKITGI